MSLVKEYEKCQNCDNGRNGAKSGNREMLKKTLQTVAYAMNGPTLI